MHIGFNRKSKLKCPQWTQHYGAYSRNKLIQKSERCDGRLRTVYFVFSPE